MSLRQIAQNLGVSITTVSRALAGYADVSAATRERVMAEAERLKYVPNEVARRLQSGRADALGLVIPGGARAFEDRFFLSVIEGVWTGLEGTGVDLLVMSVPEGPGEARAYRRLVEGRKIDGLILPRIRDNDARIDYLAGVGFPFVAFGARPDATLSIPYMEIDVDEAAEVALAHLAQLGHRRIAFLSCDRPYRFSSARVAACRAAADRRGLELVVVEGSLDESGGYAMMADLLERPQPPTACISVTDRIGIGATRAVQAAGLAVGSDVSLLTFGDNLMVQFMNPPLTAIRVPAQEMAAQAVTYLIARRDGMPVPLVQSWRAELVVRESTGPAPQGRASTGTVRAQPAAFAARPGSAALAG